MTEDPTRLTFRNATTEAAERQATALERIAETLDTIAALLAAPAALRATGLQPVSPTTYKPDAEGWVQHDGVSMPVEPDMIVDVRMRDGEVLDRATARNIDWSHNGTARGYAGSWEITAYRIAK